MDINSRTKFLLSLNYFLKYGGSKNPRWCRGKKSALLKLLIISIQVLNFSFLTQFHPEIWTRVIYLPLV